MICAIVGFTSNLLVFQIIAIVIYKSSIVAGKDRSSEVGGESNNIILHEIKGQYELERQLRRKSAAASEELGIDRDSGGLNSANLAVSPSQSQRH